MADRRIPSFVQGLPRTRAALAYAEVLHEGQRRDADGAPFILHPLEVASLLYYAGAPDHVVAAGALHDVIEDTDAAASDLRARFGLRIANLVVAVSDDERIADFATRKAALRVQVAHAGPEALAIFAADKISKVRELRLDPGRGGVRPGRSGRLAHYRRSLELLDELMEDSPLVDTLRDELAALSADRVRHVALSTF
jgi:hypothetical protein